MQARERDGDRAEGADAHHSDRLRRLDAYALERLQHHGPGLDEHGCIERDVLGETVHDAGGYHHQLAVAAGPGEADGVVVPAQVRLARVTAQAGEAGDVALAHDPVARLEAGDTVADLVDCAAPLVPGDYRIAHPPVIE